MRWPWKLGRAMDAVQALRDELDRERDQHFKDVLDLLALTGTKAIQFGNVHKVWPELLDDNARTGAPVRVEAQRDHRDRRRSRSRRVRSRAVSQRIERRFRYGYKTIPLADPRANEPMARTYADIADSTTPENLRTIYRTWVWSSSLQGWRMVRESEEYP